MLPYLVYLLLLRQDVMSPRLALVENALLASTFPEVEL